MSKFFRPWMAVITGSLMLSLPAVAQWGSGMYPAQPSCRHELKVSEEVTSIKDEIKEREKELREAKSDLRRVKSRLSAAKSSVAAQRDLFKLTGLDGPAFNFIERHINSNRRCRAYKGSCAFGGGYTQNEAVERYPYWYFAIMMTEQMRGNSEAYLNMGSEPNSSEQVVAANNEAPASPSRMPAADLPQEDPPPPPPPTTTTPRYQDRVPEPPRPPALVGPPQDSRPSYTPPARPGSSQCSDDGVPVEGGFEIGSFMPHCGPGGEIRPTICGVEGVDSPGRGRNRSSCEKYITSWQEKRREEAEMLAEKLRLEAIVKELEALTKVAKVELREANKEFQREQREAITEGGCIDCIISGAATYQPRKASIWETVGNFALAGVSIYSGMQSSKYIADQNAKLGFQSSPMPLAGAAMTYGYPFLAAGLQGVLPGGMGQGGIGCSGTAFGGGQQMGPYGMAGPGGVNNGYGAQGFSPGSMWGLPQNMYGTPAGHGMFNPGMGAGFQVGFGQNNFCPSWPCPIGAQGAVNGLPNGFNPMVPGFLTPGMSAGGAFGGIPGGFNPGFQGGFNPGLVGGNFQAGGGGFNPLMNHQMQQMQQQMAMQQYNLQMQQQMRNYQNQMVRQQALTGLYTEMQNLQMRIQQTQTQMSSGGMLGFDSGLAPTQFGTGFSAGVSVIPGQVGVTPQPFGFGQPGFQQPAFQQPGGYNPAMPFSTQPGSLGIPR